MQSEGRLVWDLLRKVVANSRVTSVTTTVAAAAAIAATAVACTTTVASAASTRRKRLRARSIGVLNLISPGTTTKACVRADELVQGHFLTLFLLGSHDCGWLKSYAQRSGTSRVEMKNRDFESLD
jgi:hypothetical protein